MNKKLIFLSGLLLTCLSLRAQNVFTAIEENDALAVKSLLAKGGVDINAKDADGNTPLLIAVKKGQERIVKLLLQKDPNIDVKDKTGNTPLLLAAAGNNSEIVYALVSHFPDMDARNPNGTTALIAAVKAGNTEATKGLLAYGAKASIKDNEQHNAAYYARAANNTILLSMLNTTVTKEAR